MNESFDALAKALASEGKRSRRQVLRTLAVAMGAALFPAGANTALAAPKPDKKCSPPRERCRGTCCLTGEECCDGRCVRIHTTENCFTCGDVCGPGQACCHATDTDDIFQCESLDDKEHCGACNNTCSGSDAACCGQTCTNTDQNPTHCGCCDCPCEPNEVCCNATCTNLGTDSQNCGGCGIVCDSSSTCVNGSCVCASMTCGPGTECCTNVETSEPICCAPHQRCNPFRHQLGQPICNNDCPEGTVACGTPGTPGTSCSPIGTCRNTEPQLCPCG